VITLGFDGTDRRVVKALIGKGPALFQALRLKFSQLALRLQQKIQGEKLQGQVLQHRSGKLAGSIRALDATTDGTKVDVAVEGGGGVAPYAAVQNYGGKGEYEIVPINKKALAFLPGGANVQGASKAQIRTMIRGFGSKSSSIRAKSIGQFNSFGGVVVKKVIHPPLPERNFMESTAEEMLPEWVSGTKETILQVLRERS
jgi:phage gpG-like protein